MNKKGDSRFIWNPAIPLKMENKKGQPVSRLPLSQAQKKAKIPPTSSGALLPCDFLHYRAVIVVTTYC